VNVSLTPKLEAWVRNWVASGRYTSSSEVIREALRFLKQRETEDAEAQEALKAEIRKGVESGPSSPLDFDDLRTQARLRLDQGR
jgi:antitoxin ParD1/3/4